MRRRLTPFVQVAFVLLSPFPLLAQHVGLGGSTSPTHFGGQVHVGPAPSLPGPSRSPGLPSGPMALRPGVRFPSSPIREGQYRPPTGPSHRPDNDRHGVGYRTHDPYIYAGYTWLNSFGYGLPVAYGGLPYDNGQEDTGGPQPGPQPADRSVPGDVRGAHAWDRPALRRFVGGGGPRRAHGRLTARWSLPRTRSCAPQPRRTARGGRESAIARKRDKVGHRSDGSTSSTIGLI